MALESGTLAKELRQEAEHWRYEEARAMSARRVHRSLSEVLERARGADEEASEARDARAARAAVDDSASASRAPFGVRARAEASAGQTAATQAQLSANASTGLSRACARAAPSASEGELADSDVDDDGDRGPLLADDEDSARSSMASGRRASHAASTRARPPRAGARSSGHGVALDTATAQPARAADPLLEAARRVAAARAQPPSAHAAARIGARNRQDAHARARTLARAGRGGSSGGGGAPPSLGFAPPADARMAEAPASVEALAARCVALERTVAELTGRVGERVEALSMAAAAAQLASAAAALADRTAPPAVDAEHGVPPSCRAGGSAGFAAAGSGGGSGGAPRTRAQPQAATRRDTTRASEPQPQPQAQPQAQPPDGRGARPHAARGFAAQQQPPHRVSAMVAQPPPPWADPRPLEAARAHAALDPVGAPDAHALVAAARAPLAELRAHGVAASWDGAMGAAPREHTVPAAVPAIIWWFDERAAIADQVGARAGGRWVDADGAPLALHLSWPGLGAAAQPAAHAKHAWSSGDSMLAPIPPAALLGPYAPLTRATREASTKPPPPRRYFGIDWFGSAQTAACAAASTPGPGAYAPVLPPERSSFNVRFTPDSERPGVGTFERAPLAPAPVPRPTEGLARPKPGRAPLRSGARAVSACLRA
ncbi:hypothetical protein KFE25_011974 [Diacronema lutheri]|uniref:Uncharacterized protein n=1 Tax=Diacronema lutheri TaxID=2081491 RepID=A0A8J5X2R6_DIALT|nr:hypothetical protein KFE25_011974 [Diacronema lutheri]